MNQPRIPRTKKNFWQDGEGESLQMSSLRALLVLRPRSCSNSKWLKRTFHQVGLFFLRGQKTTKRLRLGPVGFFKNLDTCGIPIVNQVEKLSITSEAIDSSSSGWHNLERDLNSEPLRMDPCLSYPKLLWPDTWDLISWFLKADISDLNYPSLKAIWRCSDRDPHAFPNLAPRRRFAVSLCHSSEDCTTSSIPGMTKTCCCKMKSDTQLEEIMRNR